MKKRLKGELELYTILQILSICISEKVTVNQILNNKEYRNNVDNDYNQLRMFDL